MPHLPEPALAAEASDPTTSAERLTKLSADPRLRSLVAGNPTAPADLLIRLAEDQDACVREHVAGNPNTSWPTLEQLAWEFPHAFLHNPVGPFQLMAHPEQVSWTGLFWEALLQEASVPSCWWNWLQSQGWSRKSVRLHIQSAGEMVHWDTFPQDEGEDTLLALTDLLSLASQQGGGPLTLLSVQHAPPPVRTCEQLIEASLQRLAQSGKESIRLAVAEHSCVPVKILHLLAKDCQEEVREAVAEHARTPVELLHVLARDEADSVRMSVAINARTPVELLRVLARDEASSVRGWVARHAHTPGELLHALAQDDRGWARRAVAGNEHTPNEVLHVLARDQKSDGVQMAVASNTHTPEELLRILASNEKRGVRWAVAGNEHTPKEVLRALAQDQEPAVREAVASNAHTPAETLHALATDQATSVRAAIAKHAHVSVEVLQTLARDQRPAVREAVASNAHTPVTLLQVLATDHTGHVRWLANLLLRYIIEVEESLREPEEQEQRRTLFLERQIAERPIEEQLRGVDMLDAPASLRQMILASLATMWDTTKMKTAFEPPDEALDDDEIFLRDLRAKRENLRRLMASFVPAGALQKLATFPSWEVRSAVALHAQTPWETRQHLSQDGNRYVRALARAMVTQLPEQKED